VIVPGRAPSEREEIFYRISPRYFKTLRTPLLDGRDFQLLDSRATQPIPTIINLAFARKYFGSEHALDKEFQRPQGKELIRHRVVGVAANAHYGELRKGAEPIAYVPLEGDSGFTLYVRSPVNIGSLVRAVEREGQTLGPLRVQELTTLESLVGNTILREKLLAGISGIFAFLGLLLAAVGMFGLLSYSVTRRTKEIGIRTAMGAQGYDIVFLIVKELGAGCRRSSRWAGWIARDDGDLSIAPVRNWPKRPSGDGNSSNGVPYGCICSCRLAGATSRRHRPADCSTL
jgi:putative ABC transport system permease protein